MYIEKSEEKKKIIIIIPSPFFPSHRRFSVPRLTCSSTHRATCGRPSRTSVHNVRSRLPTRRTCRNTREFISASSRTDARSANAVSLNSAIFSNTYARIQAINHINVDIPAVIKLFRSSARCRATADAIKRISRTNVIRAINASRTRHPSLTIFRSIRRANI